MSAHANPDSLMRYPPVHTLRLLTGQNSVRETDL